ncbi:ADP-ribosylation factor GTPase activating protein, ER-Golgi transport [Nowakowskiella sp. JEL0407]|nr:ADP-ribosylation factor GTPase activating protein, ER-Golgi transport [Nowakowskiella sp. JEL0407]
MKVGGNANASEFFKQYGGAEKYKDAKSKYTSKPALLYKERLRTLVDSDAQKYPGRIQIDSLDGVNDVAEQAFAEPQADDFFSDWNVGAKSSATPSQSSKVVSESATPTSRPGTPASTAPKLEPSPTIKSSPKISSDVSAPSLQESPTLQSKSTVSESAKVSSQTATVTTPAPTPVPVTSGIAGASVLKSNKKGLGAKKATKVINFDEAERKAKEEEEIRRKQIEEEEKKKEEEEKLALFNNPLGVSATAFSSRLAYNDGIANNNANGSRKSIDAQEEMMERLGMGFGKVGFGATSTADTKKPTAGFGATTNKGGGFGLTSASSSSADTDSGEAANRFGKAKAISSDQYFKRGGYDESESAEVREKLRGFEGKSGFGSDDYFGRSAETRPAPSSSSYGSSALGGNMDAILGSVGESAKEFAMRFAEQASEDLNSLNQIVRSKGQMLGEMLQDLQAEQALEIARREPSFNAKVNQVLELFPMYATPTARIIVELDLLKNKGNVENTCENIIAGRLRIPTPPPAPQPSSSKINAPSTSSKGFIESVDLNKPLEGETPSRTWDNSPQARQQNLRQRKEFMIKQARQKFLEQQEANQRREEKGKSVEK